IIQVTSVTISATSATIKVNQSKQLTATVLPSNASDKAVIWKSSNTKIATISQTGKVTARFPGTTTITVTTKNGKKATCKVTVQQPVTSVKLNKTSLQIKKGKTYKLVSTVYPTNASNQKVTWKSSNKAIVTVSSTGMVRGVKMGTAYVTVVTIDGKKSARCKVVVK
ncbi:MAG: Ig-like domain-containing protein, partial [Clostridia bacterium]